jgi:hypothetical protein
LSFDEAVTAVLDLVAARVGDFEQVAAVRR